MTENKLYKIMNLCTNGWNLIDDRATNLTREQCTAMINDFIAEGYNPNSIKAVDVNDSRFP
jgi:hypothetical protein